MEKIWFFDDNPPAKRNFVLKNDSRRMSRNDQINVCAALYKQQKKGTTSYAKIDASRSIENYEFTSRSQAKTVLFNQNFAQLNKASRAT